ncbi:MAG TPA: hypothetical protein VFX66_03995 [Sulfuricurvum sp.]|nr:hypothetical protein [Sulfuricurvum sp.]
MTYNNTGISGCSARGIAKRASEEELLALAEELKESISNIHIEKIEETTVKQMPLDLFINMKKLK